jgi:beta-lactam-binding protein with PASTA domain
MQKKPHEEKSWDRKALEWLQTAGRISWRIMKWPLLVAVPIGVFTFTAWWSLISALSGEVLTVPDVRGKTIDDARFALASRSLDMTISEQEKHSQEIDKGLVIESDPPAGSKIKRGRNVKVTLSAGFKRVMVPNLLWKSVREAEMLGRQRGFRIISRDTAYSGTVPVGHIIAQDPDPDTAFVTETMNVLVSLGPHPKLMLVPKMEGKLLLPVLQDLREKGLPVTVRRRGESRDISTSDPYELRRMEIYRQWPEAGSYIDLISPETIILRVDWKY